MWLKGKGPDDSPQKKKKICLIFCPGLGHTEVTDSNKLFSCLKNTLQESYQ